MNIDKKAGHIDPKVALSQAEHEKGTVPGQQIGLYGNADKRDVPNLKYEDPGRA